LSFIPGIYNFYEIEENNFTDLDNLFLDIKESILPNLT
jgi:hypothetical protein